MTGRFLWGSSTHEGQVRAANEDNVAAAEHLFVVADGMGGHLAGEVASQIAVDILGEWLQPDHTNTVDDLVSAIGAANERIFDEGQLDPDHAGMGTTITAIAVIEDPFDGASFGVANVGDSRIYLLRHDKLRQITIDHSFVQELVAEGAITREEARNHPRRNIVTRGLGIDPFVRVDSWTMPIIRDDRFVLCSDGLSDYVHEDDIQAILEAHPDDPQTASELLVAAANDAGGHDNITVIVVDVLEGDDPPDPTQEFDIIPVWEDDDLPDTGETRIVADPPPPELASIAAAAATSAGVQSDDADSAAATAITAGEEADSTSTADGTISSDDAATAATPKKSTSRGSRLLTSLLVFLALAVLVGAAALFAAWARSGYFIAFDDTGDVVIYQGQPRRVLIFEPTFVARSALDRSELSPDSIELVESQPRFSSRAGAEAFVTGRLEADSAVPADNVEIEPTAPPPEPATATTDPGN